MFTNSAKIGKIFDKEIKKQLSDADHVEIATGYFGYKELEQITPQLVRIAAVSYTHLTLPTTPYV